MGRFSPFSKPEDREEYLKDQASKLRREVHDAAKAGDNSEAKRKAEATQRAAEAATDLSEQYN